MIQNTDAQDIHIRQQPNQLKRIGVAVICIITLSITSIFVVPHVSDTFKADLVVTENSLRLSTVSRGDLMRDIVTQGKIIAANSPTLFSPQQGTVVLQVKAGDKVEQGEPLALIISPQFNELYERESSRISQMKLELERQIILSKRRKLELQQAEDMALVDLKASNREKRRAQKSIALQLISALEYEQALDDLTRATLKHKQAIQNNALEQESLDFEVSALQLQLQQQEMLVKGLQRQVSELTIVSPVDGMIGQVQVQTQQAVTKNQALITVVDLSAFEIESRVSESYADELVPLMDVEINLGGQTFAGILTAISPEVINNQVVTRIRFSETMPSNLRQNQRLTARIVLEKKQNVLMIDRGSFIDSFTGSIFKRAENVANRTNITLGSRSLTNIEILDGLTEGDTVIVSNIATERTTKTLLITH